MIGIDLFGEEDTLDSIGMLMEMRKKRRENDGDGLGWIIVDYKVAGSRHSLRVARARA
jgi:hypothetical protein